MVGLVEPAGIGEMGSFEMQRRPFRLMKRMKLVRSTMPIAIASAASLPESSNRPSSSSRRVSFSPVLMPMWFGSTCVAASGTVITVSRGARSAATMAVMSLVSDASGYRVVAACW